MDPGTSDLHLRDLSKRDHLIADDEKEELGLSRSGAVLSLSEPSGFKELAPKDYWNFALLVLLYLLQGIPIGLTLGSLPFLLKQRTSYSDVAIFSLSSWPYSLKLLWAPIVDSVYSPKFGRRKSWIVPTQLFTGSMFFWLGWHIDGFLSQPEVNVYFLTGVFFSLIFLSATQDIAVDGWALTLLSKQSLSYASTAQTIGINSGFFLSFTVFLALNSSEFSNKYFRTFPQAYGILSLGNYLLFWAVLYFSITFILIFMKKEERHHSTEDDMGISGVYTTIIGVIKMPHIQTFICILLLAKIGFICNEAVTGLKLLELGFKKEDLALAVLIDFPFQIIFGYYSARWSQGPRPLLPWLFAFYGRLAFAIIGMLVVRAFPSNGKVSLPYFCLVIISMVLSNFTSTVQLVSISAFMTGIADPIIGGTYMTLLQTFNNFGGTWPKFFVLKAVDYFSVAQCTVPDESGNFFSCVSEHGKNQCKSLEGKCNLEQDGYYYVGILCIVLGFALLNFYIKPKIRQLEKLPKSVWKLSRK
ncbi:uncharacterized protein VTP21DRAFT_528 [Calcarisporiella thermophila]|uniref:uncharacterized protein n=1 Tax=Calcarisporiella thermophila TaxID=911321 RepID=UPI003743024C